MEIKKNKEVDEHKRSPLYLTIGLVLSASMCLAAFEWKSYGEGIIELYDDLYPEFDALAEVPPTIHTPPNPPVIQMPKIIEVEEDEDIMDDIEVNLDIDFSTDTSIDDIIPGPDMEEEVVVTEFLVLEEQASFPGGNSAWGKFLDKNLRYPRQAKRMGIEGRVFLQFDVSEEGKISNIEVIRDIGGGCGDEAIRVLSKSPRWNPGMQRGVPVKSRHIMHFVFKLR